MDCWHLGKYFISVINIKYPNLILLTKLMVNNQYVKQQTQWGGKFNDKSFFVLNFLDKMLFLKAQVATTFTLTYDYCVLDGTKCFVGASTIHKNKYIKLFKQILSRIPLFCSIFMEKTMSISFARQRCFFFFFFNWALLDTMKWFHILPEWFFFF